MIKIVGYKRTTGNFTSKEGKNIDFDNLNIYIVCKMNSDTQTVGESTDVLKIKWSAAPAILGLDYNDFPSMVGKVIDLCYTGVRYPKLEQIYFKDKRSKII